MGFFSFITADTEKSVSNTYSNRGALPVWVLCPDGTKIFEDDYEGYGVFGGRDAYALVAQWNKPEQCKDATGNWLPDEDIRSIGIALACYDSDHAKLKFPIKIVEHGSLSYGDVEFSRGCPDQGYFYASDEEDEEDTCYMCGEYIDDCRCDEDEDC